MNKIEAQLQKANKERRKMLRTGIREPLLVERQSTHGSFADNARFSQRLKAIFETTRADRTHIQNEALDAIALKLSRILSGQANFKDHWDDIAGYARLAAEEIESLK